LIHTKLVFYSLKPLNIKALVKLRGYLIRIIHVKKAGSMAVITFLQKVLDP